jgi:prophage tail gpP-like protein
MNGPISSTTFNNPRTVNITEETAVITVDGVGGEYQDWESVFVQLRYHHAWDYCRFTSVERREDKVMNWQLQQLIPCVGITVNLANQLAFTGTIVERQISYDPNNHGIQLLAKNQTMWGYKSSVNTKTSSFDNMPFIEIANQVLAPYLGQAGIVTKGTLNSIPFDKVQCQVGESCWDFLERLARPRGIVMGSDRYGNYVFIGTRLEKPVATLQEGVNIKSLNATINIDDQFVIYRAVGQSAAGSNGVNPVDAGQQEAEVGGSGCKISLLTVAAEQPVKPGELQDRANNEKKWREGAKITATAVVYGWRNPDDGLLWNVGDKVTINSPMIPMINEPMSIQRVTFEQDRQGGTRTTLDLVMPWMLNDVEIAGLNPDQQLNYDQPTDAAKLSLAPR